jgi:hypothetical protein
VKDVICRTAVWALGGLAACMALVGCSKSDIEKLVVRGVVRYEGQPVANGEVRFIPIEGTKGPVAGGPIVKGEYIAEAKGGVPVGKHRVEIVAFRPAASRNPQVVTEGGLFDQYLPAKYNTKSTLTVTIDADNADAVDFSLSQ